MKAKRSIIAAAVSAAFVLGLAAVPAGAMQQDQSEAGTSIQVYTGNTFDLEWSEDGKRNVAESICPQVALDEETAGKYPKLADAFARLNERKKADATQTYQELLEEAKNRFQEDPDYAGSFTDTESWNVVRADAHAVSLLGVHTGFAGGAHGFALYDTVNFDPETGDELKLSELVTDEAAFMDYVKKELYAAYPEIEEDLTEEYFSENTADNMTWTAGYEGITCYFNEYTLGPYAIGSQMILVPYEGHEQLFAEAIQDVPENFGMEFMAARPLKAGGREIIVNGNLSEYQSYESISILLDGEETVFDEDIYTYSIEPAYLKANGEEYLYLEYSGDNDYRDFDIYRLGEKPERIGLEELAKAAMYVEEDSLTAVAALTDPEHMLLSKRMWLLGTTSAQRLYRVGADGRPEPVEEYFHVNDGRVLTTKEELTCEEVDEKGNVIGTITIPAGTKTTRIRTDTESMVDLKLEDGRIARVQISGQSYPQTIDGKDAEDLFDGIMLAG